MTIETSLQSIESKLDAMALVMQSRHANDKHKPAMKVELEFNKALATLGMIQDQFVGDDRDPLNDEIMYWTIEAAKDQLKSAWFKLAGRDFGMAI